MVSDLLPRRATRPTGDDIRWRRRILPAALACTVAGLVTRLAVLRAFGGLSAVGGYDDGVYFAAGAAFANGHLPYRDFFFIQPPGIVWVLAPFGALGGLIGDAAAFGVGRLAFVTIGALNAGLAAIALRRFGPVAAVAGGLYLGLTYPAAYADRSTLLEPLASFGIITAIALLAGDAALRPGRRGGALRLLSGLALGFAVMVKIWYIVPAVVIAAALLVSTRSWRRALQLVAGVASSFALLALPFFFTAPGAMWRQVVDDQLGRPRVHGSVLVRLMAVLQPPTVYSLPRSVTFAVVAVLVLTFAAFAWTDRRARALVVLTAACALLVLTAPSFYEHYTAIVIVPLALVVGTGVAAIARRVAPTARRRTAQAIAILGIVGLCALGWRGTSILNPGTDDRMPAGLVTAMRAVHGCIATDLPSTLILSGTLTRQLRGDCAVWVDLSGRVYQTGPRARNPHTDAEYQAIVRRYLQSADAVLIVRKQNGLSSATVHAARSGPVLYDDGRFQLHAIAR